MSLPERAFVVAVSGTSGSGKTTLALRAAGLLASAACLHFDHYVVVDNDPAAIRKWLEAGASFDAFQTPRLPLDIRALAAGGTVEGRDGAPIGPVEIVLVEEPFGRSRRDLEPLIDFAFHLDVPADIALARRLIRALDAASSHEAGDRLGKIRRDLATYLAAGREAYIAAEAAAMRTADMVLDGRLPADELAARLVAAIRERQPGIRERQPRTGEDSSGQSR